MLINVINAPFLLFYSAVERNVLGMRKEEGLLMKQLTESSAVLRVTEEMDQ